jgi:hypothetical protein
VAVHRHSYPRRQKDQEFDRSVFGWVEEEANDKGITQKQGEGAAQVRVMVKKG